MRAATLALSLLLASACGDPDPDPAARPDVADAEALKDIAQPDATDVEVPVGFPGTQAAFDLSGDWRTPETFFDFPYPSDLRLTAQGTPDLSGLPNPNQLDLLANLAAAAMQHPGFPMTPVAWFRFDAPLAPRDPSQVIPADAQSPLLLVDVDPDSPARGALVPLIALTLEPDPYTPPDVLAIAPRPGFVLAPETTYALVVRRSLNDAQGQPLGQPDALAALLHGHAPAGPRGQAAAALYAPLRDALALLDLAPADVAAATVFTTGDPVRRLAELSEGVLAAHDVDLADLALDPDDGADHERFCELHGTLTLPQFQRGVAPFDSEGLFELDAQGAPIVQRSETIPVVVTVPRAPMPAGGYPLVLYFHGSGGLATQVVDRGPDDAQGNETKGLGPAHVLAQHGFGTAGSAHPVNPERVPGASAIAYLNFANLAAFRDTFRQGVIEQRLYLEALLRLQIPPAALAGCDGPTLPEGEDAFRFRADPVVAMGQSMGGMYTNLVGAVEPRLEALVPTGAGGYWSHFAIVTDLLDIPPLLSLMLGTEAPLSLFHPVLHTLQTAWEDAEPMVFMPRLARRPLPGHPVRPVYEPVGKDDSYFPTPLFDAMALAYGHQQAGDTVWPSMQQALALAGLDGLQPYPVSQNLTSLDDAPYTGVVVQYEGDGKNDPHDIFTDLEEVRYQYGCFFASFLRDGVAIVPAPAAPGTPCP